MLEFFFQPKSIAVIGASSDSRSVGFGLLKNLISGGTLYSDWRKPFDGKIWAVNPKASWILNQRCYPSISAVPEPVDLAIIAVPAATVPKVLEQCGRKKVKAVIVISSGFAETGPTGARAQARLLGLCRRYRMRMLGPNCLGLIRPGIGLNASFAPTMPPPGAVCLISQSGALIDSAIDWALASRYGFSALISVGNAADIGFPELLRWAGQNSESRAIALYLESVPNGRELMAAISEVVASKAVVALKAGRTEPAGRAISTHIGSIASPWRVYDAALRQSGAQLAQSFEQLFDLAKALAFQRPCANSIAIVSNGGGAGVLAADACAALGLKLVQLKAATISRLEGTRVMHPAWSRANPVDLVGDALPERYAAALDVLLAEPGIAGLIVIQTLQTVTDSAGNARVLREAAAAHPEKAVIAAFMGGSYTAEAAQTLEAAGIPNYPDPARAAAAMAALVRRFEWLERHR